MDDDQPQPPEENGAPDGPPVVLPSPNTRTAATGMLTDAAAVPLVAPPPSLPTTADSDDAQLADRVEQVLAEDGRFASFIANLTIAASQGIVTLGGPVPSPDLKRSLLATVHALPGVVDVQDRLQVAAP